MLAVIPSLLSTIFVAPFASPSHLSGDASCIMRVFGRDPDSKKFIPSLLGGPFAEIGNLVHRAIEIADQRSNLLEVFDHLVNEREIELSNDKRKSHYSDLRSAVGESKWLSQLIVLKSHIGPGEKLEPGLIRQSSNVGAVDNGRGFADLIWPSINYEVPFHSPDLGLSGRIDRIEVNSSGDMSVIDVKTGLLVGSDGEYKIEYLIQLAAYELLVKEKWPVSNIKLFLEGSESHLIELSPEIRAELLKILNSFREVVGKLGGMTVDAYSAQQKGPHCLNCPIRHRCKSYREVLVNDEFGELLLGQELNPVTDGFGRVVSKRFAMGQHVVNLKTSTDRTVQLRSKYEWQVSQVEEGSDVFFFNFAGKPNGNRIAIQNALPVNFSDDYLSGRNWSAEIFTAE